MHDLLQIKILELFKYLNHQLNRIYIKILILCYLRENGKYLDDFIITNLNCQKDFITLFIY